MDKVFKHPLLQGVGIGLRSCHYSYIETHLPRVPYFEVLSDNYFDNDNLNLSHLDFIRSHYPITLHGVGMSLGSCDPLNKAYLLKLKNLIQRTEPLLISDHISWTSFNDNYYHDLLPLPYTEEAVLHIAKRIIEVQLFLDRRIMIENVSTYLNFSHSTLTEWEFINAIAEKADTLILLDINNVYVNAYNNQFNAEEYLKNISINRIAQLHLAGFEDKGTHLLDSHGNKICDAVWSLYQKALQLFGPVPTVIERDHDIPSFSSLYDEAIFAQTLMDNYVSTKKITETVY